MGIIKSINISKVKEDERILLEGIKANNKMCQKIFFETYYGLVMGVAKRYFKNEDERWNVVNDTFMKVFKNISSYENGTNINAWIRKYATFTALEEFRKHKIIFEEINEEFIETNFEMNLPSSHIEYEELFDCLMELPISSRMVFDLYVFEGFKHQEIALKLNISEGTSKWHLNNARKRLQEIINEKYILENSNLLVNGK